MKSPRELLLADMVAAIEKARAEGDPRLPTLEREYKFARMIPGLPVTWEGTSATVAKITDKSIQIKLGDRLKWVPLDSLTISE